MPSRRETHGDEPGSVWTETRWVLPFPARQATIGGVDDSRCVQQD
jgi:hypothetical protein